MTRRWRAAVRSNRWAIISIDTSCASQWLARDIKLTVDADLQDLLMNSLQGASGAAVLIDANSGALMALLSQPSYDPNRLDADWGDLVAAEGKPFFNRALQGNYQLGGNIYLLWLARAIDAAFDLSLRFTGASDPAALDDGMAIDCLIQPGADELTLPQALSYGCPAPFLRFLESDSTIRIAEELAKLGLNEPAFLPDFPQPEQVAALPATAELRPEALARRASLGQGAKTTTPLHLARIMAALANDGLAPTPWLRLGARRPGGRCLAKFARTAGRNSTVFFRHRGAVNGALERLLA